MGWTRAPLTDTTAWLRGWPSSPRAFPGIHVSRPSREGGTPVSAVRAAGGQIRMGRAFRGRTCTPLPCLPESALSQGLRPTEPRD
ncbi:hypothetical protein SKAU_G00150760 [Synaphobranchus kaupii]|uniref:Uncharacterized protein n=1 Tax=Synaphobranchus kaupii TaxID=118154 RepID=A0A9Q1FGP7_SYNKA|nr:hypothetical protein SKAU_G00150760 [Synaphobranchus kaupii]